MESAMLSACSLKALSLLNHTVQSAFAWSNSSDSMVCGPDHGPGVDVKEAAARSLLTIPVAGMGPRGLRLQQLGRLGVLAD